MTWPGVPFAVLPLPLDDVQQIFVVLAVLYLVECIWWVRGDACRLFRRPWERWSDIPGDAPLSSTWRFGSSNPLPWSEAFAAERFRFPFDVKRVLVPVLVAGTGKERYEAVAFDDLAPVEARERDLLFGGRIVANFTSHHAAEVVADRLERLRTAAVTERRNVAEEILKEAWDVAAARDVVTRWRSMSAAVRDYGSTLTILSLVVAPVAYVFRAHVPEWGLYALLAVCVVTWLATAGSALRLRPEPLTGLRVTGVHRWAVLFSPASAMRYYDTVGREVLWRFEPFVVTLVLGPEGQPSRAAVAHLRDALYSAHRPAIDQTAADAAQTAATLDWYLAETRGSAMQACLDAGFDLPDLLRETTDDESVRTYCPRCGRHYTATGGECDLCGLALVPIGMIPAAHSYES